MEASDEVPDRRLERGGWQRGANRKLHVRPSAVFGAEHNWLAGRAELAVSAVHVRNHSNNSLERTLPGR